ncbi:Opacity protein [Pseudooceanicola antarcticus]|uniref:Opacity protein n=1 Tax=Pseudooceanicola antarcticus TaxID=1247613 RepID=A0A285JC67_9RHOB|nr:outer membrane beta-barrel protein [Pseudooceanicola antarcticus]PJE30857.1 porin family protein [Pseudooceanicola antarcticus]SNY57457.1 Opacity protein [Pseudooceanicola antarcticus]
MKKSVFASAIALVALVAPAAAVAGSMDAPAPTPSPAVAEPISDWSGAYAGLILGTGDSTTDFDGFRLTLDHGIYGAFAGYSHDMGDIVLSAEISYERVSVDSFEDLDRYDLVVRAGYDLGQVQPYVSLGVARLELPDTPAEPGVSIGIGADLKVSEKFTLGAEYRYSEFNDEYLGMSDWSMSAGSLLIRGAYHF